MRLNLGDDPAVIFIATETGLDQDAVVGKLHRFWAWVSEHSTDGLMTNVVQDFVDRLIRTPGFAAAMVKAGWLGTDKKGLIIPKFDRHMSESAKKRAVNAIHQRQKRQKIVREMSDDSGDESGTRSPSLSISNSLSDNKKNNALDQVEWIYPQNLTAACQAEWLKWIEYKSSQAKRKRYANADTAQTALNRFAKHGPNWFLSALEKARINSWQGPVEPENEYRKPSNAKSNHEKNLDLLAAITAKEGGE